jgi:hypothetical protein
MDEVWSQTPCGDDRTGLEKFSFARAATLCVSSSDTTQVAAALCCADFQGEWQPVEPSPASALPGDTAGEEDVVEVEAPEEDAAEAEAPEEGSDAVEAPEEPFPASGLPGGVAGEEGVVEVEAPEEDIVEVEAPKEGVAVVEAPEEDSDEVELPEEPFPAAGLPGGPADREDTEEEEEPPRGWDGFGSAATEGTTEFQDLGSLLALPALSLLSSAVSVLGVEGRLTSAAAQGSTFFFPNDAAVQRFLAKFDPEFVTDLSEVPGIKFILDYHVGQGAYNLGDFGGADAIKGSDAAEILRTDYLRRKSITTSRGTPLSLGVGNVNGVLIVSPELTVGEGGASTAYLIDEVLLPPGYHSSLMVV